MSGFHVGKSLSKQPLQQGNFGRRVRTRVLTGGAAAFLAMGSLLLSSTAAHAQPTPPIPVPVPVDPEPDPVVPVPVDPEPDPVDPEPDPVVPVPVDPEPDPAVPVPGLPIPGIPTTCVGPETDGVLWFHVCVGQPSLPELVARLDTGVNISGISVSVSDARYLSLQAITGGCNIAFTPIGNSDTQANAGPSVEPISSRSGTANFAGGDGVLPTAFTESTYVSPLPSDSGLPAVGAAIGAATTPVGHSDASSIVTHDEAHGEANAGWLGIALAEDLHT